MTYLQRFAFTDIKNQGFIDSASVNEQLGKRISTPSFLFPSSLSFHGARRSVCLFPFLLSPRLDGIKKTAYGFSRCQQ